MIIIREYYVMAKNALTRLSQGFKEHKMVKKVTSFFHYWILSLLCIYPVTYAAGKNVCAVVKIRIEQTLSLERQAFDAALTIYNETPTPLENIDIDVHFKDAKGNAVIASSDSNNTSAQFYIRVDDMVGVIGDNVSGNGRIAANSQADIHWLIIPSPGAAGNKVEGQLYFVGATLNYTEAGTPKVMAIGADSITVKPTPELNLDYFLTKDVYADNPLTPDVVEEAEPFKLGVLVSNTGIADASNVSIRSAQPKIIENKQDLLIDFSIIGSKVNGKAVNTGLQTHFGNIPAGKVASGYWIMKTTLAGTFTDISATVSHAENLGGQLTALIKSDAITSHLLAGYVLNNSAGRDNANDFLADDGKAGSPVYRLYETDGQVVPVKDLSQSAKLTYLKKEGNYIYYRLTVPKYDGLLFVDIPDPTLHRYPVTRATTLSNRQLPTDNIWTQFIRENGGTDNAKFVSHLRLFDIASEGRYDIAYNVNRYKRQPPMILMEDFLEAVKATPGKKLRLEIRAIDVNGDEIGLIIKNLPAGATFTRVINEAGEVTYVFEWTPTKAGKYEFIVEAFDGNETSTETIVVEVGEPTPPPAHFVIYDGFEE